MARKYIKFSDGSFVIFDETLQHKDMAAHPALAVEPVSAGFIALVPGGPYCVGGSNGLGLKSDSRDTGELLSWLRG